MEPHEVKIGDCWWRVTQIAPDQRFRVEQHAKGVGWGTIMEPAILRDDNTLFHDNSFDKEIVANVECAIESYLENENRIASMIPGCHNATRLEHRVMEALELIERYGTIDGDHHKQWVIDQIARKLTGDNYELFRAGFVEKDEDELYDAWEEGCPP